MAGGWKRCQSLPTDQTRALSIKWRNSERNLHYSSWELRGRMIMLTHSGHQRIVKTNRFLRDSVWFSGIDRMAEEVDKGCVPCQAANYDPKPVCEPLHMSQYRKLGPWQEISMHLDFCGPFPSGHYLLVMTDDFSQYPCRSWNIEVKISKGSDSAPWQYLCQGRNPLKSKNRQWSTISQWKLSDVGHST